MRSHASLVTEYSRQYLMIAIASLQSLLSMLAIDHEFNRRVPSPDLVVQLRESIRLLIAAKDLLVVCPWTGVADDLQHSVLPSMNKALLLLLWLRDAQGFLSLPVQVAIDACSEALVVREAALRFQVFDQYAERHVGA